MTSDENSNLHRSPDDRMNDYLTNLSQRLSRRGMFARVGQFVLRASGILLLPLLPIDRRFTAEAQSSGCAAFEWCGLCGNKCNFSCCSGVTNGCPSCLQRGHFAWTKCCYSSAGSTGGGECILTGIAVETAAVPQIAQEADVRPTARSRRGVFIQQRG